MGDCVSDTQTVLFNFVRFWVSIRDGAFIVQVARESLVDTQTGKLPLTFCIQGQLIYQLQAVYKVRKCFSEMY